MSRYEIIQKIGAPYLQSNIENGEFSYAKALSRTIVGNKYLDLRFFDNNNKVAVLVETKIRQKDIDKIQLFNYVKLEQELSHCKKIIAILANTINNDIRVWKITDRNIDNYLELDDRQIKSFSEYIKYFCIPTINDEQKVLSNTNLLNDLLHSNGIKENTRSQFVGTCMLALKNGLMYENLSTPQIIAGIKSILGNLLTNDISRAEKLTLLSNNVLHNQHVEELDSNNFNDILYFIKENILPYISDNSTKGQDLLSYFFTTFNKYVNRGDKNQAFTPNHITHFMCKVGGIHKNIRVLDPTCGSGTFLVQAMTQILALCETDEERNSVKKQQIFGIENDKEIFGLATTNMLIHGDGNSNIILNSCFDKGDWMSKNNIDLVLMNPPFNAQRAVVPEHIREEWKGAKEDPSKGLYFVRHIADSIKRGKLLTLLPMQCAIKVNTIIADIKNDLLRRHTLDAVFSFPSDMFYPGANAVVCCMVFILGAPHPKEYETFFGYFKNDGFAKRKGVGRIDIKGLWEKTIENEWIHLYKHRLVKPGLSALHIVTSGKEEWCAEAYMETDYSTLTDNDFIRKMQDYASFLVKSESF